MSAQSALKMLSLSGFRGASIPFSLEFEKDKKLTLIYGENGTGKTTICDAFEFLARDTVGSLEDRGLGQGVNQYLPTVGQMPETLSVILETEADKYIGKLSSKKAAISSQLKRPRIELLRRKKILELIEAQPAKRYEAIKRFIDISDFEKSENSLRELIKSLNTILASAFEIENSSLSTLHGYYVQEGSPPGLNPVSWAEQKLAQSGAQSEADIKAIEKLRKKFDLLVPLPDKLTTCATRIEEANAALTIAQDSLEAAATTASADASGLLDILEAGEKYLHDHSTPSECPLCQSSEKVSGLADAVKARLQSFAALKIGRDQKIICDTALAKAKDAFQQLNAGYTAAKPEFWAAVKDYSWPSGISLPQVQPPENIANLKTWLDSVLNISQTWPTIEASWRDEAKFLAALKRSVEEYKSNLTKRMEIKELIPHVENAHKICIEERQAFTDDVIQGIAEEVGRLYEAVHPGEGLEKISLPLDPKKRASIELEANFSGEQVPPQAYFSQSHLDTLGLCVFLALALQDSPAETILILDDVLGSVDEPHVERVIQMIYGVSKKFRHCIITTHYRIWREKYRWGWLRPDQPCHFVELTGWGLEIGIRVIKTLPEIEMLKALTEAQPQDPQAICAKAGVILEAALDYLTLKYQCRVPRKAGEAYTIADLLHAISGSLRTSLKAEIRNEASSGSVQMIEVELKPILDEIDRIAQARNVFGAHFKAISFEMLDADALGFAEQILKLMDALVHPEDGWPDNDKSGSYWRNRGDSRRLHPLKKPG